MTEYEKFVDSIVSANIPQENTELRDLVTKFQVHHHSKTCKKYAGKECRFGYGQLFSKRTIIAKPLSEQLLPFDKAEILAKQKSILDKVKDFIDTALICRASKIDNYKHCKVFVERCKKPMPYSCLNPLLLYVILK